MKPVLREPPTYKTEININWKEIQIGEKYIIDYQPYIDQFMCKICTSLVKNPISCSQCDNLFCSDCLKEPLKFNTKCPLCNVEPFEEGRLNRIVKNTLYQFKILCPLECKEKLLFENLEKHLKEHCKNSKRIKTCNLCKVELKNEAEISEHDNNCKEIQFNCSYCKKYFKNDLIDDHIKECSEKLIECETCICKIPFKLKNKHENYSCSLLSEIKKDLFSMILILQKFNFLTI